MKRISRLIIPFFISSILVLGGCGVDFDDSTTSPSSTSTSEQGPTSVNPPLPPTVTADDIRTLLTNKLGAYEGYYDVKYSSDGVYQGTKDLDYRWNIMRLSPNGLGDTYDYFVMGRDGNSYNSNLYHFYKLQNDTECSDATLLNDSCSGINLLTYLKYIFCFDSVEFENRNVTFTSNSVSITSVTYSYNINYHRAMEGFSPITTTPVRATGDILIKSFSKTNVDHIVLSFHPLNNDGDGVTDELITLEFINDPNASQVIDDPRGAEQDDNFEYHLINNDQEYEVRYLHNGYGYEPVEVTVPSTFNDKPVTTLVERCFHSVKIVSVTLPETLTTIGDRAFDNLCNMTSITIPSSVTSIGVSAFQGCSKLIRIINKSALEFEMGTFNDGGIAKYAKLITADENDDSIVIDQDGLVTYNDGVDIWAINYIGVSSPCVIKEGITAINREFASNLIHDFYHDIDTISIPNTVHTIEEAALHYYGLDTITVAAGNEHFKTVDGVLFNFEGTKLISYPCMLEGTTYVVPEGVTEIADFAFAGSSYLETVTLPTTLQTIGECAFVSSQALHTVNFADIDNTSGLTTVGYQAFDYCPHLYSLALPDSVTFFDRNFYSSGAIRFAVIVKPDGDISVISEYDPIRQSVKRVITDDSSSPIVMNANGLVTCWDASLESLWLIDIWKESDDIVLPELVFKIGKWGLSFLDEDYEGYNFTLTVTLPSSVIYIDDYAFEYYYSDTIYFNGTLEAWNAIEKSDHWNDNISSPITVICTDGNVVLG